jgi:hypothetical protein
MTSFFFSTKLKFHLDEGLAWSCLLLGLLLLFACWSDISVMIGLVTILELILFLNYYLNPSYHLIDIFQRFYCSLIFSSLCSFISHQNQRKSPMLTKIAFILFHILLWIVNPSSELNVISLMICVIVALFLFVVGMSPSGIESIVFYWAIYHSSDWVSWELSPFRSLEDHLTSLELTNLIGASGLLSVLFLGHLLSPLLSLT